MQGPQQQHMLEWKKVVWIADLSDPSIIEYLCIHMTGANWQSTDAKTLQNHLSDYDEDEHSHLRQRELSDCLVASENAVAAS